MDRLSTFPHIIIERDGLCQARRPGGNPMGHVMRFIQDGAEVQVILGESPILPADTEQSGFEKAGIGTALRDAGESVARSFQESLVAVSAVAASFSETLKKSELKPAVVEVTFGLEASGKADVFVIGNVSGKSNFQVKMTWKFAEPK